MAETPMQTREVVATNAFGQKCKALAVGCPECGSEDFNLFVLILPVGQHNHLECVGCGTSFCQGGCEEVDRG